jgi:hypothetical protein
MDALEINQKKNLIIHNDPINSNTRFDKEKYRKILETKCEKQIVTICKQQKKVYEKNPSIPLIGEHSFIYEKNYNAEQLRIFTKYYKLKVSGNKKELMLRIYSYLYLFLFATKIQKVFRGFLVKKYLKCHGPALFNRTSCNNTTDFYTMEPLIEINGTQFFSFKDVDGFNYGFDVLSLYNLLEKKDITKITNPYNRSKITKEVLYQIKSFIRLSKILQIPIDIHIDFKNIFNKLNQKEMNKMKTIELFHNMDLLGNYSCPDWFFSLDKRKLINFILELRDLWMYRAPLTLDIKKLICPPNGDPFRNFNIYYIRDEPNIENIRKVILNVMEQFINYGVNNDNKYLGASYVLGCLTLVNKNASESMPWLYQAFHYNNHIIFDLT